MKNRYGKEFSFEKVNETTYKFVMAEEDMLYMRCGGKRGQNGIDENDLGFFDPPGGPFVSVGYEVEGKSVTKIMRNKEGFFVEVEQ